MDDQRIGAALRAIRIRAGRTQEEVAIGAGVPRAVVGRIERGPLRGVSVDHLRAVASALGASIDLWVRWHGGDLGRLVNARHSALHEAFAGRFGAIGGWLFEPEVSFSIGGERGAIDVLGWHAATGALLVVELKTEFVDINDLMATVDRKRRLAARVAADRGWLATSVSSWVVVAESRTNRRGLARHETALRSKFPDDGRRMSAWMRRPSGRINALGFLSVDAHAHGGAAVGGSRGVQRARTRVPLHDVPARRAPGEQVPPP